MKVKQVIKLLEATYEPDDELMIDWVDKEQFDEYSNGEWKSISLETWSIAVGMIESASAGMVDMDYVRDIVNDATEEAYQRSR